MRIASSTVEMTAARVSKSASSISHEIGVIVTTQGALNRLGLDAGRAPKLTREQVEELQREGEEATQQENQRAARHNHFGQRFGFNQINRVSFAAHAERLVSERNSRRMDLLFKLLEAMTGRRIQRNDLFRSINESSGMQALQNTLAGGGEGTAPNPHHPDLDRTPVTLTFHHSRLEWFESEKVCFSATARIVTQDGREFNIDMAINMTRELYLKFEFSQVRIHRFIDPLVINFDAVFAGLCDTKMTFDLDADGSPDQISRLLRGSGYLAVCDGSGEIHDGRQLFGALCGNGFAHLARYDSDGNNWIDANDEIWDSLRLWVHNDDGTTSLIGLGELGIGAIFLGNKYTDFTLTGETGDVNGAIRRTGIFLFDNGEAGTVQHLDLRV